MPRIELLWWAGCPSLAETRDELVAAMTAAGLDPGTLELIEVTTEDEAERQGFPGSPTIRVDGRDLLPDPEAPVGLSCRLYRLRDGRPSPSPDPADLRDALARAAA